MHFPPVVLAQANGTVTNCFSIDYFAKERYTPEPHDSTMAIPCKEGDWIW